MCTTLCPEVFQLNDDGYSEVQVPEVPAGLESAARQAIADCPSKPSAKADCRQGDPLAKGYIILTEAIKDPEGMKAYGQAAGAAMGGVNILAVDTSPQVLEGNWHGDQTVVLEFDSVEAARKWYESEAYQNAAKLRQAAADCNAVIISGFEARRLRRAVGRRGRRTHLPRCRRVVGRVGRLCFGCAQR
ncbi:4Fe-4S single cluster domain protein [Mycobacterium xenopi 4042]|uniref:4Fe-4S single cluster domain protein n=1 Tax=Mycobacterium xenopi 4042 TaxID=1299334 RepID=X8AHA3_MYCXE|nr:4Fe-4S single cluster domain protein [Mycobacterium xenopi 4042]